MEHHSSESGFTLVATKDLAEGEPLQVGNRCCPLLLAALDDYICRVMKTVADERQTTRQRKTYGKADRKGDAERLYT